MAKEELLIKDRPVHGDITETSKSEYKQYGVAEFLAAIDTILDVEGVEAVRWDQYTPYFNDGDACEFSIHDIQVKLAGDDESGDYEDGFQDSWTLTYYAEKENRTLPAGLKEALKGWKPAHFEDVAKTNFGDHARVIATKAGFDVEYKDHE